MYHKIIIYNPEFKNFFYDNKNFEISKFLDKVIILISRLNNLHYSGKNFNTRKDKTDYNQLTFVISLFLIEITSNYLILKYLNIKTILLYITKCLSLPY